MLFQLYILINPGSLFDYPYIAIDSESKKVIGICKEYVEILDRENASLYNPGDFIPTSRSVECPMEIIDSLVHGYIGEKQYTLLLRFTQDNHVTLTYREEESKPEKEYDIYATDEDGDAAELAIVLTPFMKNMKREAFAIDAE